MKLIDNINDLLGDDIQRSIKPGARLKIAASCFSIYAYEALKRELEKVESFEFIFTSPAFTPDEVTDAVKKERREFHMPKSDSERNFYGTEFEVQLKNKLTQRAIARECSDWMRRKAKFRSNGGSAPMQQLATVQASESSAQPADVSEDFVKLLAKREPLRAVFRDAGFASDSVKINVEQIFKLISPGTEVKTI
jgi:hypothetical protein